MPLCSSFAIASDSVSMPEPTLTCKGLLHKLFYTPVSYFGVSKGGQYGAMYGYRYPFVQKWLLLNLPVMINWHKSRAGLMKMSEEQEVTMIFGERDPSYPYAELIDLMRKENIKRVTIPNEDHTFSHAIDEFLRLPEQFLFP